MRKSLVTATIVSAAVFAGPAAASATTPPGDPNDVEAIDNPVDENDDEGFDDWGLLGLIGLVGLAGLAGRRRETTYPDRDRDLAARR